MAIFKDITRSMFCAFGCFMFISLLLYFAGVPDYPWYVQVPTAATSILLTYILNN